MRSSTWRLEDLRTTIFNLGFVGENEHRQLRIDCKEAFDEYPTASPSLTVCPPEGESYPAVIERDGDFVLWTITDSDLVHEGSGEIQLSFTVSETVAKSYPGRIKVMRSIVPTGEIPEGIDDFLTRAGAALTAIPETIDEALAEAKASGEFDGPAGPAGQDGADGQDGYSPTATVSKSGKTATITITDKNGTTTAQISDGEGGGTSDYSDLTNKPQIAGVTLSGNKSLADLGADPTSIIDDTAGSGDTGKTWSADKTASVTGNLLSEISQKQDAPETAGTAGQVLGLDNSLNPAWVDKYSKPAGGIPGTDLADSYIKEPSSDGTNGQVLTTDGNGGRSWTTPSGGGGNVTDVQINGTSILSQGVANIPYGTGTTVGVVKVDASYGLQKFNNQGLIAINPVTEAECKGGTVGYKPVCPERQHFAVFYGLSKIAGYDLKSVSVTNGVYPSQSIDKILQMLGVFDLIAQHETTPSTHAYAQGECFIFNGKLCRATTAISVSDAITVGTNCENTTLMAEITR